VAPVAYPFRVSRVAAELRSAVRPVPKVIAWRPRVVAEAAMEFESAEQLRVAGSMLEAMVLQRRAAAAPGSARSFAEAELQARRLAVPEASAAPAAVLPGESAAQAAAALLRAEHAAAAAQVAARHAAEAPRQEAEAAPHAAEALQEAAVRVGAAVRRPEAAVRVGAAVPPPEAAQAGVARQPEARGAQAALLSRAVFLPCRLRVLLAP
jgi:hypothetical protein